MPRAKVHKSKEDRRRANCEKSARYYQKNREDIKAKNREHIKEARARLKQEIQAEEVAARRTLREDRWRKKNLAEKRYCKTHEHLGDSRWRIGDLQNTFDEDLGSSAYRWLDNVYQEYQHRVSSRSTRPCPLDAASNILLSYIRSMEKISDEVINEHGVCDDWRRARQFIRRVRLLLDCCYDMELKILDPEESLEESYAQSLLAFQKPTNRAWIDGKAPLPE
ncbi:hypothetical protein VNI00_017842 [Paramarasmius palmivorus]|uniref:Uncharacterized protein n=1 Tax=Paramarasmius palmivorus TaxID=297713 RepID=A0AAW0B5H8_9AGAR